MGKSPGKWIKTVLFGKKPTQSSMAKGKNKTANEREILVPGIVKATDTGEGLGPPAVSYLTPNATDVAERNLELDNTETLESSDNQEMDPQGSAPQFAASDPESIRQESAAARVQAAFRGYLARRAFWALKGIIRLQALIRGHLVRRQAVATLSCVLGIVKLQALARGRKVRTSISGQEVYNRYYLVKPLEKELVETNEVHFTARMAKMSGNAFVRKLLASSPTVMPLRLYYEPMEPNSVSSWVERWSTSQFWKPIPMPKKPRNIKAQRKFGNGHMLESETGKQKRSVRRVPAANIDNNPGLTTSEYEKPKRNPRKVPGHTADAVQLSPQSELEKVKRNLRKVHNPVPENSAKLEIENEKSEKNVEKPATSGDNIFRQSISSGEKPKKETNVTKPKESDALENGQALPTPEFSDAEANPEPLELSKASEEPCPDQVIIESKPSVDKVTQHKTTLPSSNGDVNHKDEPTSNENNKSGRKAWNKQEHEENVLQSSPTLPSYMAATESAKAKLRLQGSPRLSQDGADKTTRRYSLPSSTNTKISSQSPRTQRAVNGSTKGANKNDKSVLSSRDGNAKGVQVEWRR